MNYKIGDNSVLFPKAIRSGVTGVLDFKLSILANAAPALNMDVVSIPLFASALLLSGYQSVLQRLLSTFTGGAKSIINLLQGSDMTGILPIAPVPSVSTVFVYSDATNTQKITVSCAQINYFDLLGLLSASDLLKITNIRITIPVTALPQTKQNIYFFRQNIFGAVESDQVNVMMFFNPENQSGATPNDFVIDVPVNYFISDKIGIAFDLLLSSVIMNVSIVCEKYFNHSFENSKTILK